MAVNGVHFDKSHVFCTDLELHGFIVNVNYPIVNRNSICITFEMMDTNGRTVEVRAYQEEVAIDILGSENFVKNTVTDAALFVSKTAEKYYMHLMRLLLQRVDVKPVTCKSRAYTKNGEQVQKLYATMNMTENYDVKNTIVPLSFSALSSSSNSSILQVPNFWSTGNFGQWRFDTHKAIIFQARDIFVTRVNTSESGVAALVKMTGHVFQRALTLVTQEVVEGTGFIG